MADLRWKQGGDRARLEGCIRLAAHRWRRFDGIGLPANGNELTVKAISQEPGSRAESAVQHTGMRPPQRTHWPYHDSQRWRIAGESLEALATCTVAVGCIPPRGCAAYASQAPERLAVYLMALEMLEGDGDRLHRRVVATLYEFTGEHPAKHVLWWKHITDGLEEALNNLEGLAIPSKASPSSTCNP
jgi:hypothetical protein